MEFYENIENIPVEKIGRRFANQNTEENFKEMAKILRYYDIPDNEIIDILGILYLSTKLDTPD